MKVRALSFTTLSTACSATHHHIPKELNLYSVLSNKPTVKSEISEEK